MNKEIKTRWIDALRSGKYKQTQRLLKSIVGLEEHYCCLGVLCDVLKDDVKGQWRGTIFETPLLKRGSQRVLPCEICMLAEVSHVGNYTKDGKKNFLTDDNDTGKTFEEIANIIEENF